MTGGSIKAAVRGLLGKHVFYSGSGDRGRFVRMEVDHTSLTTWDCGPLVDYGYWQGGGARLLDAVEVLMGSHDDG